jgi:protein SCO1/2
VCPAALGLLTRCLDRLGDAADRIQPLYVTVDPDRDTPDVMRQFLGEKYPRFLGLTGSATEIAAAKNDFKVFAQKKLDAAEPDGYSVPHTAFTFILDKQGDYLGHFANGATEDEIVERLHVLVGSAKPAGAA